MSDTTEAMRAALLAEIEAFGNKLEQRGRASGAVILAELLPHLRATHPTPAVTGSTHTGAVPAQAWMHEDDPDRVIAASQKATALRDGGASASSVRSYTIPLAAQPSPERNDCEPVDVARYRVLRRGQHWSVIDGGGTALRAEALDEAIDAVLRMRNVAELLRQARSERNDCEPVAEIVECNVEGQQTVRELDGRWKFLPYGTKLYTAPPPPAERHYCERCGKRLGHTEGVHTCTPPGYEVQRAIKEGERNAASDAYYKARDYLHDTRQSRDIFDAGFDRGWDAATKEPQQ